MGTLRTCAIGLTTVVLLGTASCSSSAQKTATASSGSSSSSASSSARSSSGATGADRQSYLDRVNALCDALLPKVLAVMQGGHPDVYPVAEFMAELPQHAQLEADFDAQLAQVAVPADAATAQAAFQAYITYANGIDAKRLAAARQGQAAFDAEIRAENAEAPTDPVIAARTAAGFHESCNAR